MCGLAAGRQVAVFVSKCLYLVLAPGLRELLPSDSFHSLQPFSQRGNFGFRKGNSESLVN
jgi:hypothetical protein